MIVIPMAGRSQRFTDAGYDRPKYMLPLHGRSVFAHAVGSFEAEFGRTPFLIIANADAEGSVRSECAAMGVEAVTVVALDRRTAGQAETVEMGLHAGAVDPATPITIFNIDTFRPDFRLPGGALEALDGWLEVFRAAAPTGPM